MFSPLRCLTHRILALFAAACLASPSQATTRYVSPCGQDFWTGLQPGCIAPSGPKRTIQAAINASIDGDTILVLAGTHVGAIDLDGKAVHIIGASGPDTTIIDGDGADHAVTCNSGEGADTIIEGLRIIGGDSGGFGGGVLVNFSAPTFINCQIINNHADSGGGGVSVALGSPSFQACLIAGNTSGGPGGGVYVASGNPSFADCDIQSNSAATYGGGAGLVGGNASFETSNVSFNDATHGGGVSVQGGTATILDSLVELNEAETSGGGVYVFNAQLTMTGSDVVENYAVTSGAGIAIATGGSLDITDAIISGNVVEPIVLEPQIAHGGGIRAVNATVTGSNLIIVGNNAFVAGGVSAKSSDVTLTDSLIWFNDGSDSTGGLGAEAAADVTLVNVNVVANTSLVAGGISAMEQSSIEMTGGSISDHSTTGAAALSIYQSSVHATGVVIENNDTVSFVGLGVVTIVDTPAGAVQFEGCDFLNNVANIGGGAVYMTDTHASFEACDFEGNASLQGGAMAADNLYGPNTIEMRSCVFHSNSAVVGGGALALIGETSLQAAYCQFYSNEVPDSDGGAIFASGASLELVSCDIFANSADVGAGVFIALAAGSNGTLTNCRITDNDAMTSGGGLYVGGDAPFTLASCTIAGNTAGAAGSAMTVNGDGVEVHNSIVWGNSGIQVSGSGEPTFRYSLIPFFQNGPGCFTSDPLFINSGIGDYRLSPGSPAAEAGLNALLPNDQLDIDNDGDTAELLPIDRYGESRVQLAAIGKGGCEGIALVDLGAFELEGELTPVIISSADFNGDGVVNAADLANLLANWGPCDCCLADLNADGVIGPGDLAILLATWG